MFRFENDIFFYAFAALPLMLLIFIWYLFSIRKQLKKLGEYNLVKELVPDVSRSKKFIKFILLMLAFSNLILALCNLQTGSKTQEVKREGADIIVCLDVSNSMLAQDLSPNRLERAKFALEKMIDKLQGDRLGIVVFAGEAYTQLPITTDYSAAKLFLGGINTQMVPTQGTNIGAAIRKALEGFSKDLEKNKTIVIITDGENHEPDAVEAAEEAAKAGILINCIGVGSENGVPIPMVSNGVVNGYRKDKDGNTVVTKLNKEVLQEIAGKTDGIFVQATNADIGLNAILDKLAQLDKKQIDTKMYTDYEDQFQWFLGLALLFFILEFFISERVSNWFRKFFAHILKSNKTGAGAMILVISLCSVTKISAQKEKELIYNGNNNYHSGKNVQAINQYREALKVSPGFKKANFNLGDAIYKEAVGIKNSKSKEPIMGMKPDSLANLMLDEAASQFDVVSQTVSNKDTLHKALHNMGNCRLKQQNYQGAVDAYKKSLKVDCKDEETRYNLAYALKKLKEQQKKDKNKNKDQQKQNPQDQQPQMSKEQAERMLNALKNMEQKLQGKKKKGEGEKVKTEKDW
ncbi:MAG TPA: VWA domain-containing protein [Bacteroidia bacterium]|jgi:Ca-activated chloride channel family protein|nr:VWA domain-containing protein [Bacteroidia bacterium]